MLVHQASLWYRGSEMGYYLACHATLKEERCLMIQTTATQENATASEHCSTVERPILILNAGATCKLLYFED